MKHISPGISTPIISSPTTSSLVISSPLEVSSSITLSGSLIITGSILPSGSLLIDGDINITGDTTFDRPPIFLNPNISVTSSWAENAITASYAMNGGGTIINTSSFATTGSNIFNGSQVITGSLIVTGSSESWTGPPHNYKISGQWYSQAENATAYGTTAHATGSGTTNSIYMVPWIITRTQTFTSGAIENTASNSLLNARFGLYRANPTSSVPQTLIYDSGNINLTGATVKTVSFASPLTLTPGLYYTAFTLSGSSPTATMRSLGVSAFAAVIGLTTPGGASNGSYINATRTWAVANANMAFPSDASTLTLSYTVGAIYATWFRLQ